MATGTTRKSGWALFWFLLGFMIIGTTPIGGGLISLLAGSGLVVVSAIIFKGAQKEEGV